MASRRRYAKRVVQIFLAPVLVLITMVAGYLGTSYLFLLFPANQKSQASTPPIEAYVISNGFHTDLVMPVHSSTMDWTEIFPPQDFKRPPAAPDWIAIGWGDREFYLNTPTWDDFTIGRGLNALFGNNPSLLHVSYITSGQLPRQTYVLPLDQTAYQQLVDHVLTTARLVEDNGQRRASVIADSGWRRYDSFYHAHGSFGPFTTCNTWTGEALRSAGVTVSRWTPLPRQVTWYLVSAPPDRIN